MEFPMYPKEQDEKEEREERERNYGKYEKALREIAQLRDEPPGMARENAHEGGNFDDAYDGGVEEGLWLASRIARVALGIPVPDEDEDE